MTPLAILERFSPRCTGPYSLAPAAGATAAGLLTAGAAAVTGGSGAGAGRATGAEGGAAAVVAGGAPTPGGSTSTVYSRINRPDDEVISTSRSMNGSFTGRVVVILT